jgi:hypothetical protein
MGLTSRIVVSIALIAAASGCGLGKALSNRAAQGGVEGLAEEPARDDLEKLATSPEAERAVEALGAGLTKGVMKAASGQDLDVAGGVSDAVGGAVDASVDAAYHNRERIGATAATTTDAVIRSLTPALAEGLRDDVLPAVGAGSSELMVQLTRNDDFRIALGEMVHEMSRQAVLGSEAGIEQVQRERRATGEAGLLERLGRSATTWAVLIPLIIALTIAVIVLSLVAARARRRRTQTEDDAASRERRLAAVLAALAASDKLEPEVREQLLRPSHLEPQHG